METDQKTIIRKNRVGRRAEALQQVKNKASASHNEPKQDALELELREEVIAEMIKALRLNKNLTQEQLATLMNVHKSQVSRLEANHQGFKFETVTRALKALGAKRISFHIEMENEEMFDYEFASLQKS